MSFLQDAGAAQITSVRNTDREYTGRHAFSLGSLLLHTPVSRRGSRAGTNLPCVFVRLLASSPRIKSAINQLCVLPSPQSPASSLRFLPQHARDACLASLSASLLSMRVMFGYRPLTTASLPSSSRPLLLRLILLLKQEDTTKNRVRIVV